MSDSSKSPQKTEAVFTRSFIKLMEARERTSFQYWLLGELKGNANHKLVRLWKLLLSKHTVEVIRELIFPVEEAPEKKFYRLCNKLQQKLEDFFAIQAFRNDDTIRDTFLLRSLMDKDHGLHDKTPAQTDVRAALGHIFPIVYKKINRRLEESPIRDAFYFRNHLDRNRLFQEYRVSFPRAFRRDEKLSFSRAEYWRRAICCEWYDLMLTPGSPESLMGFESLLKVVLDSEEASEVVLAKYTNLFTLIHQQQFPLAIRIQMEGELWESLEEDQALFQPWYYAAYFSAAFNYFATRASRTGSRQYYAQLKIMFEKGMKLGIWPASRLFYMSICIIYFSLLQLVETESEKRELRLAARLFIENYSEILSPEDRSMARNYMEMALCFYAGEYNELNFLINMPDFRDPYFEIYHDMHVLMAWIEVGKLDDDFWHHLHRMEQGVSQKSGLPGPYKLRYQNLLRMIRFLIREDAAAHKAEMLIEVNQTQHVSCRIWLRKKIEQLPD